MLIIFANSFNKDAAQQNVILIWIQPVDNDCITERITRKKSADKNHEI